MAPKQKRNKTPVRQNRDDGEENETTNSIIDTENFVTKELLKEELNRLAQFLGEEIKRSIDDALSNARSNPNSSSTSNGAAALTSSSSNVADKSDFHHRSPNIFICCGPAG